VTRRTAPAPRTRRSWLGTVAAGALLPALLAGCGEDGPGSAPDQRGDRAPDPARVSTPAPLVGPNEDPELTVPLPGPSITPLDGERNDEGDEVQVGQGGDDEEGQATGEENSEETGVDPATEDDG
jgi:hypothetical protein